MTTKCLMGKDCFMDEVCYIRPCLSCKIPANRKLTCIMGDIRVYMQEERKRNGGMK